jgi:hypothetical protein
MFTVSIGDTSPLGRYSHSPGSNGDRTRAASRNAAGPDYEPIIEDGVGANRLPAPNGSWAPVWAGARGGRRVTPGETRPGWGRMAGPAAGPCGGRGPQR